MKKLLIAVLLMAVGTVEAGPLADKIAAKYRVKRQDTWANGERIVFDFDGCEAWVVEPPAGVKPLPGMPWTWTMQWFNAFLPRTAVPRLIAQGYHHVTLDVFKMRAVDAELHRFADFQKFLVDELGFAPKARLIGMSWGGFFSVRYASKYPQNIDRIFLDCPLLNFDSFGKGNGEGPWVEMLPSDGCWTTDPRMPVNLAEPVAKAGISILLRYGGQDQTVLPKFNSELFIPRFKAVGGKIEVIRDGGYGHHPHGFEVDSPKLLDFFR